MRKTSLAGEFQNQVGSGADYLFIALKLGKRKALNIVPAIPRDSASPAVETVFFIGLLHINVACAVGMRL